MIKIKTLSNSRAGIPDYKVKKCVKEKKDLDVRYVEEIDRDENNMPIYRELGKMIIKYGDIKDRLLDISEEEYPDRFGMNEGKPYHLYFFTWRPLAKDDIDKMFLNY
jgi:hypothetical protein